jgi:hypothetical protein
MFRVSFFCDDRKLAAALRSLLGVAVGAPEVAPVDPTPRINGAGKERVREQHDGKSLLPQFVEHLRASAVQELRLVDVKTWLTSINRNPTNAQHVAKSAIRKGYLERQGEGRDTTYLVVTENKPKPRRTRRAKR